MNRIKIVCAAVCLTVGAISTTDTSQAATGIISVNIHEFAGAVNQIDGEETFGIPDEGSVAGNWINIQGGVSAAQMFSDLMLSDGTPSTVDVTRGNNPAGVRTFDFSGNSDNTPWRSGQMIYPAGTANPPFIDLAGLNATFSSYKIITYLAGFNAAAGGNQGFVELIDPSTGSSLSTQYYWQVPNPYDATPLITIDEDPGDGVTVANYAVFADRTEDTLSIQWNSFSAGVALAGFQIVGELILAPSDADFDSSTVVDGTDLLIWQRGFGLAGQPDKSTGDANGDGNVNAADLAVWELQYGTGGLAGASLSSVPEPAAGLLGLLAASCLLGSARRRPS
jgi:hypothetical protein